MWAQERAKKLLSPWYGSSCLDRSRRLKDCFIMELSFKMHACFDIMMNQYLYS